MKRFIKRRKPLRQNRIKKSFKRKALRRSMAVVARREISRAAEKKMVRNQQSRRIGSYPPNYPNFDSRNIIDTSVVLRNIGVGTGTGARIGNKIKLKRFMMKAILWPNPGSTTPVFVKMWVISDKFNPTNVDVTQIEDSLDNSQFQPGGTFFENGSQTSGALGNLFDLQMDVNKDRFTVHHTRLFKIGVADGPGTAGNNDFKLNHTFSVNLLKYMPKTVTYQDSMTTAWYTRKVFVVFLAMNYDESTINVGADVASLSHTLNVQFEDI